MKAKPETCFCLFDWPQYEWIDRARQQLNYLCWGLFEGWVGYYNQVQQVNCFVWKPEIANSLWKYLLFVRFLSQKCEFSQGFGGFLPLFFLVGLNNCVLCHHHQVQRRLFEIPALKINICLLSLHFKLTLKV